MSASISADGTPLTFEEEKFSPIVLDYTLAISRDTQTLTLQAKAQRAGGTILYNGSEDATIDVTDRDSVEVTISNGGAETVYTIHLIRSASENLRFNIQPAEAADAKITVSCEKYGEIAPNADGSYTGMFDRFPYTYIVGKYGYTGVEGSVPAEGGVVDITLTPDNTTQYEDVGSDWGNFRGSDDNMGITDAETPGSRDETELLWERGFGSDWESDDVPSVQIIVDDALVVMAGNSIYKLDRKTGKTLARGEMVAKPNWGYTPPTYAAGLIFCPLSGGTIQAFDAKTLKSVWVYKDPLGGQSISPITYSDGYIYTGFWTGEETDAHYVCLSISDNRTKEQIENGETGEKLSSWMITQNKGFYWTGSVVIGDYVIVGCDAGKVYSINKRTGEIVDYVLVYGTQRSSIAWDKSSGKVYFTVKNGNICSAKFDAKSGHFSELKGGKSGEQATSTPLVYGGRAYYGVSMGGFAGGRFVVADADTLEEIFHIEMMGYPQGSPLLTTAYDGYLYIYTTYNFYPGGITLLKMKPDAKSAEECEVIQLYVPEEENQQYCIASIICDKDGTLYYKNDSGKVFAVGRKKSAEPTPTPAVTPEPGTDPTPTPAITPSPTEEPHEWVDRLIDDIGLITKDNLDETKEKIDRAREAYDGLSEDEKSKVTKYPMLEAAEQDWEQIRKGMSDERIKEATRRIAQIPRKITKDNRDEAQAAYDSAKDYFDALTEDEKQQVGNRALLDEAKRQLDALDNVTPAPSRAPGGSTKHIDLSGKTSTGTAGTETAAAAAGSLDARILALRRQTSENPDGEALTEAQEKELLDIERTYRALSAAEQQNVRQYPVFETLLAAYGERNHLDALTGVRIEGVDWNIRLLAIRQRPAQAAKDEISRTFLGEGRLSSLYYLTLVDLLTGAEYQPESAVKLTLPANAPEDETAIACYVSAEGELRLVQGELLSDAPAGSSVNSQIARELQIEEALRLGMADRLEEFETETAASSNALPEYALSFETAEMQCWYGVAEFKGSWDDLLEGDFLPDEDDEDAEAPGFDWLGALEKPESLEALYAMIAQAQAAPQQLQALPGEELTLFTEGGVTVRIAGTGEMNDSEGYVSFEGSVVNESERSVSVAVDWACVNGRETQGEGILQTPAGETKPGRFSFRADSTGVATVEDIREIELALSLFDADTLETIAHIDPIVIRFN